MYFEPAAAFLYLESSGRRGDEHRRCRERAIGDQRRARDAAGEIDRLELVQRLDANRLKLAEADLWAAPLGEMIRRTLSANLQGSGPASAAGGSDALSVDIEEFIGDADCSVSLRAAWSLKRPGADQPAVQGHETIRIEPPRSCQVSALPEVMSRALGELSKRVLSARSSK
ncbi:MAG: ABC-type transport auxiliary lipoprotein family protein [Gammaproteobacteria bacterium]